MVGFKVVIGFEVALFGLDAVVGYELVFAVVADGRSRSFVVLITSRICKEYNIKTVLCKYYNLL